MPHFQSLYSYRLLKVENTDGSRKLQTTMRERILTLLHVGVNKNRHLDFFTADKNDPDTRKQWELQKILHKTEASISEAQKLDDRLLERSGKL